MARVTYATVIELSRDLPGAEESTSYGTAAIKVKGKLLARLKEDGETLVLRTDFWNRDALIHAEPKIFFITDHYRDYPSVLVRLPKISRAKLKRLLEDAWKQVTGDPSHSIKRTRT